MNREDIVKEYLRAFNKESIDDLPDGVLIGLLDEFVPPTYGGASVIYEESDEDERKKLMDGVRMCIEGKADIEYQLTYDEGVKDNVGEEYLDFCSRHSVWYEVIERR